MPDWVYCATSGQVGADETAALLEQRSAIWCPPPTRRPWPGVVPPEELLWLVWREHGNAAETRLLGGGLVAAAPRELFGTTVLWTDPDDPGLRDTAVELGYSGPLNMAFLKLSPCHVCQPPVEVEGLGPLHGGLNPAGSHEAELLAALQPL